MNKKAIVGLEKKMFVSCKGPKKVGRPVKQYFFDHFFFVQKYLFHAYFMLIGSWKGRKSFRVGIFFSKILLIGRVMGNKQPFGPYLTHTEIP